MHVLDNRGEVWKSFIVLIPTLGAALIAVSRIMDARHHPFDVISGSLLGIAVAWAAYRQYFPPVTESWRKGRAYPIRTWATEPKAPQRTEYLGLIRDGDEAAEPHRNHPLPFDPQTRSGPQRQQPGESQGRSSASSLDPEGGHPRKPVPGSRRQMRRVHSDGYWSSSDDHELDENGFEMQPVPVRPNRGPAGNLAAEAFGQDTSYHPRGGDIGHTAPPRHNENSGQPTPYTAPDLRGERVAETAGIDTSGHRSRGVDLVETYR